MSTIIEYFYTSISPWAYLGHAEFSAIARRHGVEVRLRPVDLTGVFSETGGLPLAKRHPARQAYRMLELQRWRNKRNVPLTLRPAHFPAPPALADRCAVVLAEAGQDAMTFAGAVLRAIWANEHNIADEAVLSRLLSSMGCDASSVIQAAGSEHAQSVYDHNKNDAIARGIFGSPSYVLHGETFWGQDRLDLLDDALTSKRGAYQSD